MHTTAALSRARRRALVNLRYLRALLQRFRVTFALGMALFGLVPLLYWKLYVNPDGTGITYGAAFHHVYFLVLGQPSLPYVESWPVELLNFAIPPLGLVVIGDGLVRFAYLFFSKRRSDKEWIEVIGQSLNGHIVICGAGRVGFRVAEEMRSMERDVIVIEKREDAAFVSRLRDMDVPVLIDDIKSSHALERTNVREAAAIVCATDDDLSNLNAALDARRLNPHIRVVIRLFDDELVAKVRDSFNAEALSTSALAAPAVALAALDPRISHSFRVGRHLMVVSEFIAGPPLAELTVSQIRDRFGGLTLSVYRGRDEQLHPPGSTALAAGDALVVQAAYQDYLRLRDFTNEATPPAFLARKR